MRKIVVTSKKKRQQESSSSEEEDDDDDDVEQEEMEQETRQPRTFVLDPILKRVHKKAAIKDALPFDNNESFLSVLEDKEGEVILRHLLQAALKEAIEKEEGTYDTAMRSRILAYKVVNTLFSNLYVKVLKFYDPRPSYHQKEGTAMAEEVYNWFQIIITDCASEYFKEHNQHNRFIWTEMLLKLRQVWRWRRNNMRKVKNRKEKKQEKMQPQKKRPKK